MLALAIYPEKTKDVHIVNLAKFIPFIHGEDSAIACYTDLAHPRIFRNEWPVYPRYYPKTIYIMRDPRAVIVSYYHHFRIVTRRDPGIDGFVEGYLSGSVMNEFEPQLRRWDRQVEWWKMAAGYQQVLFVRYEEMIGDPGAVLRRVLEFTGKTPAATAFSTALERTTFSRMRDDEMTYGAESYPGELGKVGRFIRKGRAEGWREELSTASEQLIVGQFGQAMSAVGYNI
jgi:hypothetical protein